MNIVNKKWTEIPSKKDIIKHKKQAKKRSISEKLDIL